MFVRIFALALAALASAGCSLGSTPVVTAATMSMNARSSLPVQHVVIVTMENRSFDEMFGTYPGVNGLSNRTTGCNFNPRNGTCILPYHDRSTLNHGGPHGVLGEGIDLHGGRLDGFIVSAEMPTRKSYNPYPTEVMGYHTCQELPYYCSLAQRGVLADNHFAATTSFSTMAHLYMVSGWSARCSVAGDPMSCKSDNNINLHGLDSPDFAWTEITWLLHAHHVSWGYYVYDNKHPFEGDGDDEVPSGFDTFKKVGFWNPMPGFDDIRLDGESKKVQRGTNFEAHAAAGTLPAVSWVIPPVDASDHPPADLAAGQEFVRAIVKAVETGPEADRTLIIINWDEWGGFYDHVVPPIIDGQGYGFRTPLILLGPMVKAGSIDHQLLSSDAYLKFIEDNFLGGSRLDSSDGRPDSRPDIRENTPGLGDLRNDLFRS